MRYVLQGIGAALANPGPVLVLWLAPLLLALPAAVLVGAELHDSVAKTAAHEKLRTGFDGAWYGEFRQDTEGLAGTFSPDVNGAGAFLGNLEDWLQGGPFGSEHAGIVALGIVALIVQAFLLGGVVERLAGGDRGRAAFLRGAGRYGFRFVRLGILSGLLYWAAIAIYGWLYGRVKTATIDTTSEGRVFAWSAAAMGVVALLLVLIHTASNYAKIATVRDDRSSMLLALFHGLALTIRRPLRTLGAYAVLSACGWGAVALYGWIGPGATASSWFGVLAGLLVGQLLLLWRAGIRVAIIGAQVAIRDETPT
jgi:hypothetical protein